MMNSNNPGPEKPSPDEAGAKAWSRLRGFAWHLIGYFAVMVVLGAINVLYTPDSIWMLLPLVGWGSVLAVHAAFVMGLFGGGKGA